MNEPAETQRQSIQRMRCTVRGAVQGVGFRPFIYLLAAKWELNGWVSNASFGVAIEVEGQKDRLDAFLLSIDKEKPLHSFIQGLEVSYLDAVGYSDFGIRASDHSGATETIVQADIATCPECVSDLFDPTNRRYLYPFTNCTHCGPRFSIIESLPYDRCNTTMARFEMCDECRIEYENPLDRRFHAQPNACPACGPHVELWDGDGRVIELHHEALQKSANAIRDGKVVAVKGLGGFHLMVDARSEHAVSLLRERKGREAKPLAVMFPSLEAIHKECLVSDLEERALTSSESPIVLLRKKSHASSIAPSVAPENPYLGAMLPYTPLHHVLMTLLGCPIVATSGNLSDEPICTDERDAVERLKDIGDLFLIHHRPIVRHVDDSLVRVVLGREQVLRRARGYAPLPIPIRTHVRRSLLAVGAHQKNTVAVSKGNNIFLSQHIGDLETQEALGAFSCVVESLKTLYDIKPEVVVADLHPDYASTEFARRMYPDVTHVQHHYAHVASCMAENELDTQVLGVSWDGTGYGLDGTIWGGEFLLANGSTFRRVATLREFSLPGGEKSIKEPRRTAIGLLYEIFGDDLFQMEKLVSVAAFSETERSVLRQMLSRNINSPRTSSMGRLFDAVASIVNLRQQVNFEGQAAMELEFLIQDSTNVRQYDYLIEPAIESEDVLWVIDWAPIIAGVIRDVIAREDLSTISHKFHNTLVEIIVDVARRIGETRVVLTGGCFQNKYLTETSVERLQQEAFRPYVHQRVPPNDGGIALGQLFSVMNAISNAEKRVQASVDTKSESTCEPVR